MNRRAPRTLAAMVVAAVLLPLALAADEFDACGTTVQGWQFVPYPDFGPALVDVVVDPSRHDVVFATDGQEIAVSRDGGCSWELAQRPRSAQIGTDDLLLGDLAVSVGATGSRLVAVGLNQLPTVERAPVVFSSDDDGGSWVEGGAGLPVLRTLTFSGGCGPELHCQLEVDPQDPDRMWLRLDDFVGPVPLWGSTDGGLTFSERAARLRVGTQSTEYRSGDLSDIAPIGGGRLLATDEPEGIVFSDDEGRTFHTILPTDFGAARIVGAARVDLAAEGYPEAVVVQGAVGDGRGPDDLGYGIHPDVALQVEPLSIGTIRDLVVNLDGIGVAATSDGVHVLQAGTSLAPPVAIGGSEVADMQRVQVTGRGEGAVVWVSDGGGIARRSVELDPDMPIERPALPPLRDLPSFDPFDPDRPVPGSISGPIDVVDLDVGGSAQLDWTLDVPFTPTLLDIYFVFDQTGSMSTEFDALAEGMTEMVNELIRRRIDVNVGLATYGSQWRTRQWRDIGPPDAEFRAALGQVDAGGDGEFAVTALHEAATGFGLADGTRYLGIEPGHNAHWRDGALRLVVHATDEPLKEENGPNDQWDRSVEHRGPTYDEAVEALVAQRILHLGLILGDLETPFSQGGWPLMHGFSQRTGAVAPVPVDCNGDTFTDIEPGEPLVCYVPPTASRVNILDVGLLASFADVIVALVENVNQRALVTFESSEPDLVAAFAPPSAVVDLRRRTVVPFSAVASCPRDLAGSVVDVGIAATAGALVLGLTSVTVQCGDLPVGVVPAQASRPLAAAAAPAPAAAAAPAPPAPPAQAVSSATSTASSAAQAPAPGVQGAIAGAQQRQAQAQAAGLGKDTPQDSDAPQFLATATSRRATDGASTLLVGAAMAVVAGVAELRRRGVRRTARAPVRGLR